MTKQRCPECGQRDTEHITSGETRLTGLYCYNCKGTVIENIYKTRRGEGRKL